MRRGRIRTQLQNVLIGAAAVLTVAARFSPGRDAAGPVTTAATALVGGRSVAAYVSGAVTNPAGRPGATDLRSAELTTALSTLAAVVGPLSHPQALEDAFRSYFAFRAAHPDDAVNPYLYFVDYGLPSTAPRGYVFDMAALRVVDGPFTVAHGRGSSADGGVPRRFSNAFGSASTSLGLYVAQELYAFSGHSGGRAYRSLGLRLTGVSGAFNSNARARGVVAHGAPYVTAGQAGRSEGCPAVEPERAERLLPKLAHGGLVFLFAPDERWMAADPWIAGRAG